MINEVFKSLHESIKRRNTPDSFIPSDIIAKDVIHRGYIKDATFPLKYDFVPDSKGHANSGNHVYSFKNRNMSGVIDISHEYRPDMSGRETVSKLSFEMNQGESPTEIDLHRMVLPALKHHIRSHEPDVIKFEENIPFIETLIRKIGSKFESFDIKGNTIVKKKIDPKTQRIIGHIRSKINKNKEK
jgi:hypothetical protein